MRRVQGTKGILFLDAPTPALSGCVPLAAGEHIHMLEVSVPSERLTAYYGGS